MFYKTIFFSLSFFLLLTLGNTALASDKVALVIGNSSYKEAPLKNPKNDASDVSNALEKLGFSVTSLIDVDKQTILRSIRKFSQKLLSAKVGIFYYAGHGIQYKNNSYLVPIKTNIELPMDLEYEAVNLNRILGYMEQSESEHINIIILDACRNNPFKNRSGFRGMEEAGLAQPTASISNSVIVYATQPNNVAKDGDGRNGTYTEQLLRYLSKPNLNLLDLFNQVAVAVNQKTIGSQQPWVSHSGVPTYCLTCGLNSSIALSSKQKTSRGIEVVQKPKAIVLESGRKLRILPKSASSLYAKPDENASIINSNVTAFEPLFVFEKKNVDLSDSQNPKGWYLIGKTLSFEPLGWMMAKDVIEWKQALIVSYKHPGIEEDEKRKPVLMFKNKEELTKLIDSIDLEEEAIALYDKIEKFPTKIPESITAIESMNSKCFMDIKENFYMFPIINFEEVEIFFEKAKLLQLATALPKERLEEQVTNSHSGNCQVTSTKNLNFNVKFVMDMTASMGPYMRGTKEVISKIVDTFSGKKEAQVRYGLVGYRDDLAAEPYQEFVTRNFTPQLVNASELVTILEQIEPTDNATGDYPEEMFAGVKEAISSYWDEDSRKFIILVGDASSHEQSSETNRKNTIDMNAGAIRQLANTRGIEVIAIHLKSSRHEEDHEKAELQFSQIATEIGAASSSYLSIDADDYNSFENVTQEIAETFSIELSNIKSGNMSVVEKSYNIDEIFFSENKAEQAKQMVKATIARSMVNYLGKETTPPHDIFPWVFDRDLINPSLRSLDVHVLVTKKQLNDLVMGLSTLLQAVKKSEIEGMNFFDAVKATLAQNAKGEEIQLRKAYRLVETNILPLWIYSLPYKSDLLKMTNDTFERLSGPEKSALEDEIGRNLTLYREILQDSTLWIKLDERDVSSDHVYYINLDILP